MKALSQFTDLYFLDISYAKQVTDEGCANFADKTIPIEYLCVNGMDNITSIGLGNLINCCTDNLVELEA
jgi:hypothetical protein